MATGIITTALLLVGTTGAELEEFRSCLIHRHINIVDLRAINNEDRDDQFHLQGHNNDEDDDASSIESGDEGNGEGEENTTVYLLQLNVEDVLSSAVTLIDVAIGSDHKITFVDYAYNKNIGYLVKGGVEKLAYFDFSTWQIKKRVGGATGLTVSIGRTPFQTENDDSKKAVGIMYLLRSMYTPDDLGKATRDEIKAIINGIPNEFYRIFSYSYTPRQWKSTRVMFLTPELNIDNIMTTATQSLTSQSTMNTAIKSLFDAGRTEFPELLNEFDQMQKMADSIWNALLNPNATPESIDNAKKAYGAIIGVDELLLEQRDIPIQNFEQFSSSNDAAIYRSACSINMYNHVPNFSVKSKAIDIYLDRCAKLEWNSYSFANGIKEILDHGVSGNMWQIRKGDGMFIASIIHRDNISSECIKARNSENTHGQFYALFLRKKKNQSNNHDDTDSSEE